MQKVIAEKSVFEEKVLQIRRVSKKNSGGNVIAFAALAIVGNRAGKIGSGYAKAKDVNTAVSKSIAMAKKQVVEVKLKGTSIAHIVEDKCGAAKVMLKPAPEGSGVIAGGVLRSVLDLVGVRDISSKMMGSNNKISNVRATISALQKLKI